MRLLNDIFYDYKRNLTCAKFLIVKFWSSSLAAGLWSSQKRGRVKSLVAVDLQLLQLCQETNISKLGNYKRIKTELERSA